jgi:hypothetical protein
MSNPATLNINTSLVSYGDTQINNNPKRKFYDWQRNLNGIAVNNPRSEQFVVPARQIVALFDGTRATTIDGTTTFDLEFMAGSRYRFTHTAGTSPSLATNVAIVGTTDVNVTINANQTAVFTAVTGTPFSAVQVGYTFYVKGSFDGVVGAFDPVNQGEWKVLAVGGGGANVTLTRYDTALTGVVESLTGVVLGNEVICYFNSNVQVGDKVNIEAGFQLEARKSYTITQVTSKWFEIESTSLVDETGIIPGASGLAFYSSAKRFLRIECDQEAKYYLNGSGDEHQYIQPWLAGDSEMIGWVELAGPIWSATVFNRSTSPMLVNVFSVE